MTTIYINLPAHKRAHTGRQYSKTQYEDRLQAYMRELRAAAKQRGVAVHLDPLSKSAAPYDVTGATFEDRMIAVQFMAYHAPEFWPADSSAA